MAEKDDKQGQKNGEPAEGEPKPGSEQKPGADPKQTGDGEPGPIPYDRFKEVNDKAKAYEARLAELEKAEREREEEEDKKRKTALKDQEKFQELAAEWEGKATELEPKLKSVEAELKKANELLQAYADGQMELVPELFRNVVAGLPLTDRLAWLTENADKLGKGKLEGIPATPAGRGSGDEMTKDQRRQRSARTF